MGKIFCLMGKSATGKDTIYQEIMLRGELNIKRIIPYTTRPLREGETEGKEYFFCTEETVKKLADVGKIIELRAYDTVYGIWKYFTVDDGQIDLTENNYLLIGTLDTYRKLCEYFGRDKVSAVYIEVEDGERLLRAVARERQQNMPKYEEMCRRFLTDSADFSEEKLAAAGISRRFNNLELNTTIEEVASYIKEAISDGN